MFLGYFDEVSSSQLASKVLFIPMLTQNEARKNVPVLSIWCILPALGAGFAPNSVSCIVPYEGDSHEQ